MLILLKLTESSLRSYKVYYNYFQVPIFFVLATLQLLSNRLCFFCVLYLIILLNMLNIIFFDSKQQSNSKLTFYYDTFVCLIK